MSSTQVMCVGSVLGAALLAAAIDDGVLAPADRRVLLVANTAEPPETVPSPREAPGFDTLARRFDEVIDWNALIAPLHPVGWYPSAAELPLLGRLMSQRLGVGSGCVELVLDGLSSTPASSIAALLPDAPITVFSDSLLAWGPPARPATSEQAARATRLLHLPVLDGLRPLLLAGSDARPNTCAVPAQAWTATLAELPAVTAADDAVVLVGERPGVSDTQPAELLRAVAARGHREAVFVPHPTAGNGPERQLHQLAVELGVRLRITDDGLPAEAVLARSRPALVVGGIGPALVVARDVFELTVGAVGAERVLARRKQGPERISATIVHAGIASLGADGTLTEPTPSGPRAALIHAVAYSLGPDDLADLREDAAAYLAAHGGGPYVSHERQVALGLAEPRDAPPRSTGRRWPRLRTR